MANQVECALGHFHPYINVVDSSRSKSEKNTQFKSILKNTALELHFNVSLISTPKRYARNKLHIEWEIYNKLEKRLTNIVLIHSMCNKIYCSSIQF